MTARILVVDGQATNRITLKVRLTAACYQVTTAASAQQLMDELARIRPNLILLGGDLHDAGLVELCQTLAEGRDCAGIPIVMIADDDQRLAGLRAGAAAVLAPGIDEQMLLARIRGLLRDCDQTAGAGLAESASAFDHRGDDAAYGGQVTLVADSIGRALCWKHLLGQRLPYSFVISDPEKALGAASMGQAADLYLIAANIETQGDGLRLLSELRSRTGSRDAAFVVATDSQAPDISAFALDLGAGDVLPLGLGGTGTEAAALTLQAQMSRKLRGDRQREDAQRRMLWAMTDPLTGLYNRRYAMPRLTELAADSVRHDRRFAVMIMDLDYFKRINDTYGHPAGDAVLSEIARRLSRTVGDRGLVSRHGGEEFLVILPDCDENLACTLAERLRSTVETRPILLSNLSGGGAVGITLSVGVALMISADMLLEPEAVAQHVLERADRALISAKNRGRNRVMLASTRHAA